MRPPGAFAAGAWRSAGTITLVVVWNRPGRAGRLKQALRESRELALDELPRAGGVQL